MITKLTIGGVDVQATYGLYLSWRKPAAPEPRTSYTDIPGRDGALDTTEALGRVFYDDREIPLDLIHPGKTWDTDISGFVSAFHGQKRKIVFSSDPDYYWLGRITVDDYDAKSGKLSASARCYPYKLKATETTVTKSISSAGTTVTLKNDRMPAVPSITVTADTTIAWTKDGETVTKTLSAGTWTVAGLVLEEGDNVFTVSGSGTFTAKWQEGRL